LSRAGRATSPDGERGGGETQIARENLPKQMRTISRAKGGGKGGGIQGDFMSKRIHRTSWDGMREKAKKKNLKAYEKSAQEHYFFLNGGYKKYGLKTKQATVHEVVPN